MEKRKMTAKKKAVSPKKLVPYSVYLPLEYYNKIKEHAQNRKASGMVRDAIIMSLDGGDAFSSGYKKGLRDAITAVDNCKEIEIIAIGGRYLADILAEQISAMEQ
jgi:hypothetical protein